MPTLNINAHILAFSDADTGTSQPRFRNVDWAPSRTQLPVDDPMNRPFTLAPGETRNIFNGQRSLTIDGTTVMTLSLNPVKEGVYRLTWNEGTLPGFRTGRGLTLTGQAITASVNNNATMDFSVTGSPNFTGVVVGDQVWIPDVTTGDTNPSPFNNLNVGLWNVIAASAQKITCVRPTGQAFQGISEIVTPMQNYQFSAFSAGPVQVGDFMRISAGFSPVTQRTYQLTAVTDTWVEFASGLNLPLEGSIEPTATGIAVYNDAQNFVYVETDQVASLVINGAAVGIEPEPQQVNDLNSRSMFLVTQTVYRLDITNLSSTAPMVAMVIAARLQT